MSFVKSLLLLISDFIELWSENILCNYFNPSKFIEACLMAQYMVYLVERSTCTWGESGLCHFGVECPTAVLSVSLVYIIIQFFDFLVDFLPTYSMHYWKWGIEVPSIIFLIFNFFFQFPEFLVPVTRNSTARYMDIYKLCLPDKFNHYKMSSLSLVRIFVFKFICLIFV